MLFPLHFIIFAYTSYSLADQLLPNLSIALFTSSSAVSSYPLVPTLTTPLNPVILVCHSGHIMSIHKSEYSFHHSLLSFSLVISLLFSSLHCQHSYYIHFCPSLPHSKTISYFHQSCPLSFFQALHFLFLFLHFMHLIFVLLHSKCFLFQKNSASNKDQHMNWRWQYILISQLSVF